MSHPVSLHDIQPVAIECCSHLAEPFCTALTPVWQLVVSVPATRSDHCEHEDPAFPKYVLINRWIVFADCLGRMGDVELNGSATTGLEVYEQRARLRVEHVPGMWLAVQQLLVGAAAGN